MDRRLIGAGTLAALMALGTSPALAADETVVIRDTLRPAVVEVEPGDSVTWRNRDGERHRVRSKDGPVRFDSKNLDRGESFSFVFTVPGEYPYYDHRNDDDAAYFGTVVVLDVLDPDAAGDPLEAAEVAIVDDAFGTPRVTLARGGTVTWVNRGADEHTVSANDLSFDSGSMAPGARWAMTFEEAGEFAYFCQIHPEMRATVVVVEPDTAMEPPVVEDEEGDAAGPPAVEDSAADAAEPDGAAPEADAPSIGSALELLATPPPEELAVRLDRSAQVADLRTQRCDLG